MDPSDLTPQQRRMMDKFERDMEAWGERNLLGARSFEEQAEEIRVDIRENVVRGLARSLEVRAVPREWWEPLLDEVDVRLEQSPEHEQLLLASWDVPLQISEWLQRPEVHYRPGQAPV